jgi:riboflavin biosynthesis pyrimidine reductase
MVFTVLRSIADLVLVGAGTARTEHYRPVQAGEIWTQLRPDDAPLPAIAIVTASLSLAGCERLLSMPAGPAQTIVITTRAAPADRKAAIAGRARIIEAGQHVVDLVAAVSALAELGYANILTEGGPQLLGQLAKTGLLSELCLTTSPLLAGAGAGRILTGDLAEAVRLSLTHVLADSDFLLARYLVATAGGPGGAPGGTQPEVRGAPPGEHSRGSGVVSGLTQHDSATGVSDATARQGR